MKTLIDLTPRQVAKPSNLIGYPIDTHIIFVDATFKLGHGVVVGLTKYQTEVVKGMRTKCFIAKFLAKPELNRIKMVIVRPSKRIGKWW